MSKIVPSLVPFKTWHFASGSLPSVTLLLLSYSYPTDTELTLHGAG